MTAVRLCARAVMRRRWAGVLAVALLVGIGGGAVLAAAAGARRSDTAAARLYRKGEVADLEMDPTSGASGVLSVDVAKVRKLPQVRLATATTFFALGRLHGRAQPNQLDAFLGANADGTWLYDFDRIGLLPSFRGRMPDPKRSDEIVATTQEAQLLHARIGSVIRVGVAKFDDPSASAPSSYASITLHVVGIATTPVGLLRGGDNTETLLFGTPAFARRFADHNVGSSVYVQLHHPSDLLAFERQATRITPGLTVEIKPASQELSTFARVASPYTNTLWLFALVAGIAMVLIVAQALVRMVRTDARSGAELRALGITSVGRATIAGIRATAAVLVGLVVAVVVAIAASPLFPLGLVRRVEPDPGVRIDAPCARHRRADHRSESARGDRGDVAAGDPPGVERQVCSRRPPFAHRFGPRPHERPGQHRWRHAARVQARFRHRFHREFDLRAGGRDRRHLGGVGVRGEP